MRKLIYILLLFITNVAFGQADVIRTKPVAQSGANFNKQSVHDGNLTVDFTLRIPRSTHFTLNGGKDTLGAIAYALDVHKMGVYRGSGVWDTLVTHVNPVSPTNKFTNGLTSTDSVRLGGALSGTTFITTGNQSFGIINSLGPTAGGELFFTGHSSSEFGYSDGSNVSRIIFADASPGVNMIVSDDISQTGFVNGNDYETNFVPRSLITKQYADGKYVDLTTNQSIAGNKNFSGQVQANGGVTPDGMGPINVTMGSGSPYAYYGMTRSGIVAMAMGVDNSNNFIWGTGPTRGNGATIDTVLMTLNSHMGDLSVAGSFTTQKLARFANYYSTSSAPSWVAGVGAGTSPTISIVGNNQDGLITVITGSSPTTGVILTVTMSGSFAYPTSCATQLTEKGATTWAIKATSGLGNVTNATFQITAGSALAASTTYAWTYHNGGY